MHIFGAITSDTASEVIQLLDNGQLLNLRICSPGGDVTAALAIYDAILNKNVTVCGTGIVASAAMIVLLGGATRYASQNTRFMVHPVHTDVDDDSLNQAEKDEMLVVQDIMAGIFADRSKLSKKSAAKMMNTTNYFGTDEALAMGIIEYAGPLYHYAPMEVA